MTAYLFSFVLPALAVAELLGAVGSRLGADPRSGRTRAVLLAAACIAAVIPVAGLPAARWIAGINANFSITLTAVALDAVIRRYWDRVLLRACDRRAIAAFSLSAGVILYPLALGLSRHDPYILGWGSRWLLVPVMVIAVACLAAGNRLGHVLLAAVTAYHTGILESPNYWDYLVDPLLFLGALAAGLRALWRAAARRQPGARSGSDEERGGPFGPPKDGGRAFRRGRRWEAPPKGGGS